MYAPILINDINDIKSVASKDVRVDIKLIFYTLILYIICKVK